MSDASMKQSRGRNHAVPCRRNRRGVAMVMVVLTLVVVTALLGGLLRHLVMANRQMKQFANKAQASLLAESGIERAAATLAVNSSYAGGVWEVTPEQLEGKRAGEVEISIKPTDEGNLKAIEVTAIYPASADGDGHAFRAMVRKSVFVGTQTDGKKKGQE